MGITFREIIIVFRQIASYFVAGSKTEKMFRGEIEALLPSDFEIVRTTRCTESCMVYEDKDKPPQPATDYEVFYKKLKLVIAAVEVTTGSKGYSYEMSNWIVISKEKLERMDRYTEGFVVERILVGEPHFIWADRRDIRNFKPDAEGKHWTEIKIWKPNLNGLARLFIELAKREEDFAKRERELSAS